MTRSIVRSKHCIIPLAITFIVVLCIYMAILTNSPVATSAELDTARVYGTALTSVSPNVIIRPEDVRPASFNETLKCTVNFLMNMTFPICHYTYETDDSISGYLLAGIYYEEYAVSRFLRLLRLDRRLQLIDIGANVGVYTLPAARVTQVLAVEPNWRSMYRLAKGVYIGQVRPNVTLIHNAVSNVRATFNMGVHPTNQGNAFLINTTKCKATPTNLSCNTLSPIRTILLNDLLPLMRSKAALLKVDVEGHEVNVFTDSSAGQFFDQIDIPLVFMEWNLCKRHSADVVQRLLNFFYSRKYAAFNAYNSKLDEHYYCWPENVVFKKSTDIQF